MKKDSAIATAISIFLILLGVLIFLDILPFLFVWASLVATNNDDMMLLQEKSVNVSVFKFQKVYTRNSAISSLYLRGEYNKVIEYFKDLEKMDSVEPWSVRMAIMAYTNIGDFENALKYANQINDKQALVKIYIHKKDFDKAKTLVDELASTKKNSLSLYPSKAEILIHENKWKEAEEYVDKALKMNPNYVEALYLKAKILNNAGKKEEAKKYISKAKYQEFKRKSLYR